MERKKFLLGVKSTFEQEIKNYQGPDPLKIRCDYLNSIEKDESDFACDIYTSVLKETLQIFKSDSRYRQDSRYVKLWLRYISTQRNPLDMFNKLYLMGLGIECADFWITWVSYLLKNEDYLTADKVLTMGLNNEVNPKCDIEKAYQEFLKEVGRKVIKGQICCSKCGSAFQCAGKNNLNGKEASDKIGSITPYNPLKCGEKDDFKCPMAYFEDPDPKKIRMYPFEEVYPSKLKEVCLELVLLRRFEEIRAKKEELKKKKELEIQMAKAKLEENPKFELPKIEKPTHVQATISAPTNLLNMIKMDHSINNTTMTVHTKEAMNVVQDMWNSPTPNQARPRQLFGEPQTTEEVASYPKPVDENAPPFVHQPATAPVSRKLFTVYTEDEDDEAAGGSAPSLAAQPPPSFLPMAFSAKLSLSTKGKTPLGERSEGRGPAPSQEDQLHPQPQTPQWQPFQDKNDDFSDVTCNTKAFDFILPSSTPVNKRTFSSSDKSEDNTIKKGQTENLTNLSVIYEASKERCSTTDSNSSGSVHPKTPRSTPRIGDPKTHSPVDPTFSYLKTPPFRPSSVAQTFLRTIAEEPDTSSVLFSDPSVLVNTPPSSPTSSQTFTLSSKYKSNSCDQMNIDFDLPGSPLCRFSVSEVRRTPLITRSLKSRLLARNKRALQKVSFRPVEKENLSPGMLGFPSSSFAQINFEDPFRKPSKSNNFVVFNNDKENIKANSSSTATAKATDANGKAIYQCKIIDINGNPKCDTVANSLCTPLLQCLSTNEEAVSPLKSIQKTVEKPSEDTVCLEKYSPKNPKRCSSKKNSVIGKKLSRGISNITENSELKSTDSSESSSTKICLQNTIIDLMENGNHTRKNVHWKGFLPTFEDLPQTQMNSTQNKELHQRTSINNLIRDVQNSGQDIDYSSPKNLRKQSIRRSSKKDFTDDARRRESRTIISNIIEGSEFRNIDNSDSLPERCLRSSSKYGTSIDRRSGCQTEKTSYSNDSLEKSTHANQEPLSQKSGDVDQTQASSTQKNYQRSCQWTEFSSVKDSEEPSVRLSTNNKKSDIVPLKKPSKDGCTNNTQALMEENVHDLDKLPIRHLRKSSKQGKSILTKASLNQSSEASQGTDFCEAASHIVELPGTGASNQEDPSNGTRGNIISVENVVVNEKSTSNMDDKITLVKSNDDFKTVLDSNDVAIDKKNTNLEFQFFRSSFVNPNNIPPSNAPSCSGIQTKLVQKNVAMDSIENFAQENDCSSKNSRKSSKRRSSKKVSAICVRRSSRRKESKVNQYFESESGKFSDLVPRRGLRSSSKRCILKDVKGSGIQKGKTDSNETYAQGDDPTFLGVSTIHDRGLMIISTELIISPKSTRYALRRRNCNLKNYKEQDETINQDKKSVYDSDYKRSLYESDYNYNIKNSERADRKFRKKSQSKKCEFGLLKKYFKEKNKCTVPEGFDPFCQKTIEELLDMVNFPNAFQYENYYARNSNVPSMTKIVKIGDVPYTILGDIGKGVYARVLKASRGNEILALKLEKPACKWEFYIAKEIQRRRGSSSMKLSFMDIRAANIYNNGSILEIDYAKYGTLVDIINLHKKKTGRGLEFGVVVHYAIEILDIVDYLHKCKIIHADLKPDNFVIRELPGYKESEACIQLIDFGRCIDMTLFPPETKFQYIFKTEDNKCNEMKDNKPWTYQIDLYGLASVFYCLLYGEYMKVLKKNNRWGLQKPIPRNMKRELWNPIFDALLNLDSCEDMPMSLAPIRMSLMEAFESSVPSCQLNIQSFNNVISNSL